MGFADSLTAGVQAGSWLPGCLAFPPPSDEPAFDREGKSERKKKYAFVKGSEDLGLNGSRISTQERLEIRRREDVQNWKGKAEKRAFSPHLRNQHEAVAWTVCVCAVFKGAGGHMGGFASY